MSKEFIKILARIHLVLGLIGSTYLAYSKGKILTSVRFEIYERNWLITVAIFIASFYGVLILYTILSSLYSIIDSIDFITYNALREGKQSFYPVGNLKKELKEGQWRCADCGKVNNDYVKHCGCGASKPK